MLRTGRRAQRGRSESLGSGRRVAPVAWPGCLAVFMLKHATPRRWFHDALGAVTGPVEQARSDTRPRKGKGANEMTNDWEVREEGTRELRRPCVVLVDDDAALRGALHRTLGSTCHLLCVEPTGAVELLQSLTSVDLALVDCDEPPSAQAAIFHELARWPHTVCVLMSANVQKIEQLRALGIFAPLVLDKPVQQDALDALRSATLELHSS